MTEYPVLSLEDRNKGNEILGWPLIPITDEKELQIIKEHMPIDEMIREASDKND